MGDIAPVVSLVIFIVAGGLAFIKGWAVLNESHRALKEAMSTLKTDIHRLIEELRGSLQQKMDKEACSGIRADCRTLQEVKHQHGADALDALRDEVGEVKRIIMDMHGVIMRNRRQTDTGKDG